MREHANAPICRIVFPVLSFYAENIVEFREALFGIV